MKLLLVLILALVGAACWSNPLIGQWHLVNRAGETVDVRIDETSITNIDNPLDISHYVLIEDVVFLYDKKWLIHIENVNLIGILGWTQNDDGKWFIQLLTLHRIVEEGPTS